MTHLLQWNQICYYTLAELTTNQRGLDQDLVVRHIELSTSFEGNTIHTRQFHRQWIVLYIVLFIFAILPVVDSASTPSPSSTASVQSTTNNSINDTPFNKVAGSVLVCLGIPLVSFVGLKLFVWLFPDCCKASDFKRIWEALKDFVIGCCCSPTHKTNVVAPTITKGIELFTAKIANDDGIDDEDVHAAQQKDFLRMFLTLQKTTSEFRNLIKDSGRECRRGSAASIDTLDGQIITTSSTVDNGGHFTLIDDKFRSASRSPTPPPHIVVIYPDDSKPTTPKPYEFKLIRNTDDLDGQDVTDTIAPSEQIITRTDDNVVITTPIPHKDDDLIRTTTDIDVQGDAIKSSPATPATEQHDNAGTAGETTPRSATSGQSVPRHPTKMLARANTRNSMCVIKIELPERTEPDGMEAPIPERNEKDDSSFLTAGSNDYRGESDGEEDFPEIGEVDSFYANPDRQINVLVVNKPPLPTKPPSSIENNGNRLIQSDHPERTSLVRRGSYGCEADQSANAMIVGNPCMTCELKESPGMEQNIASGDEADDDDDDDVNSYYSISCPSSNASPLTSQLNTPQTSPNKRSKRVRQTARVQDQQNGGTKIPKTSVQNANLRKHIAKQRFHELHAAGDDQVALSTPNQNAGANLLQHEKDNLNHRMKEQTVTNDGKRTIHEKSVPDANCTFLTQEQSSTPLMPNNNPTINTDRKSPKPVDDSPTIANKQQMTGYLLPTGNNLAVEDHTLRVQSVNSNTERHDATPPTDELVTVNDLNTSKSTAASASPTNQENLAKELPTTTPSNSSSTTDRTAKSNVANKENDANQNTDKTEPHQLTSPERTKPSMHTGVYTSPSRRKIPARSRTYMAMPLKSTSKSDVSRSSKSSSQSSNADSPSKSASSAVQPGDKPKSKLATLLKESSPKNSLKREGKLKQSPKKEATSSPKKDLPSYASAFSFKKNVTNASTLYNKKGFKKVPGRPVAK